MAEKPPKPIVIENFIGIAPSPFIEANDAFSDMRNIDGYTQPGSARINFSLQSVLSLTPVTASATSNGSAQALVTADFVQTGRRVVVSSSTGTFPSNGTVYYIIYISATIVSLATTQANAFAGTATAIGTGTGILTTTDMSLPRHIVYSDVNSTYYLQDNIGQVWSSTDAIKWTILAGNTISGSTLGQGLVIWKDYLFAFTNTTIEVYGTLHFSPSWTTGWQTIGPGSLIGGSGFDHVAFVNPNNDTLYWMEGDPSHQGVVGIGSLQQNDGQIFAQGTAATYTFQSITGTGYALQLPNYFIPLSMTNLGDNLVIGTSKNLIFLWDTVLATFQTPIPVREINISSMVVDGNLLYFSAGQRGNIYVFNGYTTDIVKQIPTYLTGVPVTGNVFIPSMIKHNDRIYFLVANANCGGVWSYNPATDQILLENAVSSGTYNISQGVLFSVSDVQNTTDQLLAGWIDGSGHSGLDLQESNYRYTNYQAYAETVFYNIGLPNSPRHLENFNITLGAKLTTGQGVQIYYRGSVTDSYTLATTYDYTLGNSTNQLDGIKLPFGKGFVNVQFKITLTTGANSTTTPQLNSIIID